MLSKLFDMIRYEGYTYEELCIAGGGGVASLATGYAALDSITDLFSGGDATETADSVTTTTSTGTELDAEGSTYEESSQAEDDEEAVEKKKLGTRGLQIPMVSSSSSTAATDSSSSSTSGGVQV